MVCAATAAILVVGSIAYDVWFCIKKDGDVDRMLENVGSIVIYTAVGATIAVILGAVFLGSAFSLVGFGGLAGAIYAVSKKKKPK